MNDASDFIDFDISREGIIFLISRSYPYSILFRKLDSSGKWKDLGNFTVLEQEQQLETAKIAML